jgi:hypothetical protein
LAGVNGVEIVVDRRKTATVEEPFFSFTDALEASFDDFHEISRAEGPKRQMW